MKSKTAKSCRAYASSSSGISRDERQARATGDEREAQGTFFPCAPTVFSAERRLSTSQVQMSDSHVVYWYDPCSPYGRLWSLVRSIATRFIVNRIKHNLGESLLHLNLFFWSIVLTFQKQHRNLRKLYSFASRVHVVKNLFYRWGRILFPKLKLFELKV